MKWIRIWTEETVFGSTFTELDAEARGIWFSLLPMAGLRDPYGTISICPGHGYTNEQLAAVLKVDVRVLERALDILKSAGVNKIKICKNNVIEILNWRNYQTEYERVKKYRGLKKE